jgi:hypothetical protein
MRKVLSAAMLIPLIGSIWMATLRPMRVLPCCGP